MDYRQKYLKYKQKYINLQKVLFPTNVVSITDELTDITILKNITLNINLDILGIQLIFRIIWELKQMIRRMIKFI